MPTTDAITVPTSASPTALPTSWAVSFMADPMEVWLSGNAPMSATAPVVMMVRMAAVIMSIPSAHHTNPWPTA